MTSTPPVLEIDQLRISYMLRTGELNVSPGVSLCLRRGEALGLVGESGSGKSTLAFALVRYLGPFGRIMGGRILFEGRDVTAMDAAELRAIRGRRIAMVYQDPLSSLNPVLTIGRQLMEVPLAHEGLTAATARERALAMLAEVNFADPAAILERYPHQLSGGQQQRIVIAMALIGQPALLIMDEPTTGLDVTVEAAVLELVRGLIKRHDTALLFISHNLGTVAQVCDRLAVLYCGEIVEEGPVAEVFRDPRHPYTRGLLDCLPRLGRSKHEMPLRPIPGHAASPRARPAGCGFSPRCPHVDPARCCVRAIEIVATPEGTAHFVRCVKTAELAPWEPRVQLAPAQDHVAGRDILVRTERLAKQYLPRSGLFGKTGRPIQALNALDLEAVRGETLAIVGESGCGKSTFARVLSGLEVASSGRVTLDNEEIGATPVEARPAALKRKLQMVFQNPESTLNPSHRVGYSVTRTLRRLRGLSAAEAWREAARMLSIVNLQPEFAHRKPSQLSSGQKQRVAIARALAADPEVVIADEPVSSLDVSVQAAIINLLAELQAERSETLVFISHDLAVVRYIADHVAVMYLGKVVEFGSVEAVFSPPHHPYTEALLSAVPEPDPDRQRSPIILEGSLPSAIDVPKGCPFASRCPRRVGPICDATPPPMQQLAGAHRIACHIQAGELTRLHAAGPPRKMTGMPPNQAIQP